VKSSERLDDVGGPGLNNSPVETVKKQKKRNAKMPKTFAGDFNAVPPPSAMYRLQTQKTKNKINAKTPPSY
jgi:hypothetical protein